MKKWRVTVWALVLSLALCLSLTACNGKTVDQLQNELGALLEGGGFEAGSVLNFTEVDNASEKAEEIFEKLSGIGVELTDRSKALIYDISVTKDGKEVQPSGKVKLTVPVPKAGAEAEYSVYHVKDGGEVVKISATYADGKLSFETDGFSYYVIVATSNDIPAPVEVTLIANAGEGGTITDGYANGVKLEKGSSVTLTATASDGYHFVGWFVGQKKVSEDVTYTFNIDEDTTLVARFEKDEVPAPVQVTLIAHAGEGGTITDGYANGVKLEKGSSVTLSAIPDNGYHFVGWFVGETKVSDEMRYTFNVDEDTTLVARFEKDEVPAPVEVTLIANAGEGGTITDGYANGVKLEKGSSVTLSAIPDNGYHFVGWFVGETKVSDEMRYTFNVDEDTTLVARFEKDAPTTHRFLCNIRGNGTLWENDADATEMYKNGATLPAGTKITLTAKPDDGWEFKGWYRTSGETLISTETTYTFELTDDTVVYALFEEKVKYNFLATVTPYEGGYITENGQKVDFGNGRQVDPGAKITLTAVANEGYNFKGWYSYTADQQEVLISDQATYTFTVDEPTTVFAKFEEKVKYNFIATSTPYEGGYITENGQPIDFENGRMVESGAKITLTAVANADYNFKGWYSYTADQQEVLVSDQATYTFTVNEPTTVFAKFEGKVKYNFIATVTPYEGGYITENGQKVDFGNGRQVDPGAKITLTAVANSGYAFKGWYNGADNSLISADATHTFTVTENTYVQAVFEEKPNGLRLDAHNAGFTYNENGELVTTVYQIGSDGKPNAEYVLVYATYPTLEERYLTLNTDYTIDLGGLDFTKAGTYTVTYTYKADTSLTATLIVQVVEKPADGSLTEAEWNAAMAYWKAQTNIKVLEQFVSLNSGRVSETMIYQFNGTAYSEDVVFDDEEISYKGKAKYIVKIGDKYYRIEWSDGKTEDDGFWNKTDFNAGIDYSLSINIYNCIDFHAYMIDFSYENFTYDATDKVYKTKDGTVTTDFEGNVTKNENETVTVAFTFEGEKLTKIVVTVLQTGNNQKLVRTITFGDAVVDVPTNVKCAFSIGVKTEDTWSKDAGYITENGEKAEYWYDYLDDGTELTLTAVANDGYVFKRWAKQVFVDGEYVWVTYSTDATYTVTVDGEYGALYAVFEEKPADGSLTEDEWNAAMAYWAKQTNIKVFERTVTSQSDDHMGPQIMIYQLAGTAYSYDGYFENEESSQNYKGKMTYLVKVGDKYYQYTWYDGEWDSALEEYVGGYWVKNDYFAKEQYESEVSSNIYSFRDSNGDKIVFSYANFTFDAETKSYKNSDGSIAIAFTFDDNKVLTKIVVTVTSVYEDMDFSSTSVSTVTFGDAVVDVPTNAKCSFSTAVTAFTTTEETYGVGGYITENGEQVSYWYDYLDDGTELTLTAVAEEGYVFKCWARNVWDVDSSGYVWVTYSTDATYTVTVDGVDGTLYAVFEKVETEE